MPDQTIQRTRSRLTGILAIGAGALLLAGGGGTLAYWATSASLEAGTIESGHLDLELGDGSWTLQGLASGPAVDLDDLDDVIIVPGDVLTLTQELDVTLEGDTLVADLTVDDSGLLPVEVVSDRFQVTLTLDGVGTQPDGTTSVYRLTPADVAGVDPIQITLTLTFEADEDPGQYDQGVSVDLTDGVSFALTQVTE